MGSASEEFLDDGANSDPVLSPESLEIDRLIARARPGIAARGRDYYAQKWRLRLGFVDSMGASVQVQGSRNYRVDFMFDDDELLRFCNCSYCDDDPDIVCKHKIAATLFLRDYLRTHSQTSWQQVLSQAVRSTSKPAEKKIRDLLFFSLQNRNSSWAVVPYKLPSALFPEESLHDPSETARVLTEQQLSSQAEKINPYSSGGLQLYSNVTRVQASVVKLLASTGLYYGTSYGAALDFDGLLTLLRDGPLFTGTERDPLRQFLEVCPEPGHIELEMETAPGGGTRLRARAVAGERVFPLRGTHTPVISAKPLWVLSENAVIQLDEPLEVYELFQKSPEIKIPPGEEQTFFENHLLSLAERYPLRGESITWTDMNGLEPVPRLYLIEEGRTLQVQLRFGYGDYEFSHNRNTPQQSIRRNGSTGSLVRIARKPEREAELSIELGTKGYGMKRGQAVDLFVLRSSTHPLDFLLRDVPRLAEAGYEVFGEEELKLGRVNRNRPTISFGVTSGIDWFDVQAVVQFGDMEIGLSEVRKAVKRRERFVRLTDGSIGEIPSDFIEKYRHLFALGEETDKGLRVAHHHLTLLDQLLADSDRSRTDKEFKRRLDQLRNFDGIKPQKMPRGFKGELRPYQKSGFDWLHFLREYRFGGCLADDMGTGKSVQTLAYLQSLRERGLAKKPSLMIVPRSLVFNWEREASRFTPRLRILNHASADRAQDSAEFEGYDLVLTTYGLLRRDIEMLMRHEFNYIILDEAQAIKNPFAETAKAVRLLRADHRLTLTGTPVENSTLELWSQFSFLNPGLLGNVDYFREEFTTPIERKGDETAAQFLRKMVYPFILRRTKDQVAPELPPRTERQLVCDMEPAQRKLYDEKRDYYRALLLRLIEEDGINNARFRVLEGLLRLRQICNHPKLAVPAFRGSSAKLDLLIETLETLHAEGHKALVFSQFVGMLKIVQAELKARHIPFAYLDGKTKDRQARVDAFQNDPAIPFFLISLKAGGVGLNLTAADYVIHIDPWWNPAVEMQATDRTHRIGQDKPVFIFKMIVRDSVEEKIVQLQDRKRALVTQLIATESSFFKSLTADDVATLFS